MLGVRYLVLPHINDWRPQIEKHLSLALDARISMGEISASWSGLNPTLAVGNLRLHDRQTNEQLLYVPDAYAVVSWRSLFVRDLRFRLLEVNGVEIVASRRADGRVVIAGTVLDEQNAETLTLSTQTPAIHWLLQQDRILVRDASFQWDDELRAAPELLIQGIEFNISNGLFRHQLRIKGSLPKDLGDSVELIVQTQNILNPIASHEKGDAQVFVEINDLQPSAWKPWLDLPQVEGRFGARVWLGLSEQHFGRMTVDLEGAHPAWTLQGDHPFVGRADKVSVKVNGWLGDVLLDQKGSLFEKSLNREGLSVDIKASALQIDSSLFEPNMLFMSEVAAKSQFNRSLDQQLQAKAAELTIQSHDFDAALNGSWTQAPEAALGVVDVSGTFGHIDSTKIYQYVSTALSAESREWMKNAFLRGRFDKTDLKLQGDLTQFPFNKEGQSGVFSLVSQHSNMLIDYDYVSPNLPHWPAIAMAQGTLLLDKLSLTVKSTQASVSGAGGVNVPISEIELHAPDLSLNPKIYIRAQSSGFASDYLTVLRGTPLAQDKQALLEALHLKGLLVMPLEVEFDLGLHRATSVKGDITLSDVSLGLSKDEMPIEKINGAVSFTQDNLLFNQVQGQMLGGAVTLLGQWGQNERSANIKGELLTAATAKYQGLTQLFAISGKTNYEVQIKGDDVGGIEAQLKSTLQGLSIKLPEPLGKPAGQSRPLSVRFLSAPSGADEKRTLTFSMGNLLNGRFENIPGQRNLSYFSRGAVFSDAKAVLPRTGLAVELGLARVNWADWSAVTTLWTAPSTNQAKNSSQSIFPPLQQFRLRSPEFVFAELTLSDLDLMVTQTAPKKWSARLDSTETRGDISWTLGGQGLTGPVMAKFTRLAVGTKGSKEEGPPKTDIVDNDKWSAMPAIDITIDDFTMFGSRLGRLHLEGENTLNESQWLIKDLEVSNPYAKLIAKGTWQLKGPERGVSLDAKIQIEDLGKLSDQMGQVDRVQKGSGTINANINWLNFPWVFSYAGLQGKASIDLKDGVFQHVNSRSARLLEVLSIQSLQRILSFNFKTGDEFKDGFPWNTIIGDLSMTNGFVTTKELVVRSPIAQITLTGGSDLNAKVWDMDADVRPILDMSGAALATAFVVNPIAGLSALVTQFLLRKPLERSISAQYRVRGPWDDPQLDPIGVPESKPEQPSPGG